MKRAVYILLVVWLLGAGAALAAQPDAGCRKCHEGMASPMPPAGKGPKASCIACHAGQGQAQDIKAGHRGLVANPSALDQAQATCGRCHQGRVAQVRLSPMATAAPLINQTRYLWGAGSSAKLRYGVHAEPGFLAAIPEPETSGQPVDDLLRRRCLRCHLWTKGADLKGARRSAGCAACHRPYDAQGSTPKKHNLTRKVGVDQCLTCHGGCGAGAEYVGRISRDEHHTARFLAEDREQPDLWQGRTWRPMQPDLHFKAGMACIDCHPAAEIMGDSKLRPAGLLHVGLRCTTCHGQIGRPPSGSQARTTRNQPLAHVKPNPAGQWQLTTKLGGRVLDIPMPSKGPIAHIAPGHERLACHACHSATNPTVWGRQALLETSQRFRQWQPIAAQGDPQLLGLMRDKPQRPVSQDWLTGRTKPGVWVLATFFRRFEWRIYGRGPDGRVMPLAPRFGWVLTPPGDGQPARLLSTGDKRPSLGVSPWHAHTTGKATVGCYGCHGGALQNGLGLTFVTQGGKENPPRLAPRLWQSKAEGLKPDLDWTQMVDIKGSPRQVFLVPGSRPFNADEIKLLLWGSKRYKRWLLKALDQQWPMTNERPSPLR